MINFIAYIVCVIGNLLWLHKLGENYPTSLLLSLSTLYAIIFFNLLNIRTLPKIYQTMLQQKSLFGLFMFCTMIIWIYTFIGCIFMSPSFIVWIIMTTPVVFSSIDNYCKSKQKVFIVQFIAFLALVIILIVNLGFSYSGYKLLGLIFFIISLGFFTYLYNYSAHQIAIKNKFSATETLTVRFWLVFLVSMAFMLYKHEYIALETNLLKTSGELLILSLGSFIIPLYFYQKALMKLGVNTTIALGGIIPAITFITECLFLKNLNINSNFLGFISILSFAVVIFNFYLLKKYKK
jgi:hypothetical protein